MQQPSSLAARLGAWILGAEAGLAVPEPAARRGELAAATAAQRACWLLRSRPGGLDDSVRRLERARERVGQN